MNRKHFTVFIFACILFSALIYLNGSSVLPAFAAPEPTCVDISGTSGLVPCGKKINDPDTSWNECDPCNLCHFFFMGQLIVEFLVRLSGVASLVAISIGGLLYAFSAGNSGLIEKAKSIIKYTLIGFIIVFIAWAIVDSILYATGYIDPMGGEWYSIEC